MAEIKSINIENGKISVSLSINQREYELIKEDSSDFAVLPTKRLKESLTTGKLGNSNRVMVPKKFLERSGIEHLIKNVKARIFDVEGHKLLLIKLDEEKKGVPNFD